MQETKVCNHCKTKKILSDFYKNKRFKDGYDVKCKECSNKNHRNWARRNKEKLSEYMAEYRQTHREERREWWKRYYRENKSRVSAKRNEYRRLHQEKNKEYQKKYYQGHTEEIKKSRRRWLDKNPEKRKAHSAVQYAVRKEDLFRQPCEVCGQQKSEAHHDDYSKPLEVRWLCHKCHMRLHHASSEVDNNININGGEKE